MRVALADALNQLPTPEGKHSVALFHHGTLDVYLSEPRGADLQKPHTRDEIYVVARGSGTFLCGDERRPFSAGDVLFAAAGEVHRFESFTGDFAVWVFFYGPEGGERSQAA
jgi:mannose-6-phosphate isomerase-like protein (cupin superfamily)